MAEKPSSAAGTIRILSFSILCILVYVGYDMLDGFSTKSIHQSVAEGTRQLAAAGRESLQKDLQKSLKKPARKPFCSELVAAGETVDKITIWGGAEGGIRTASSGRECIVDGSQPK